MMTISELPLRIERPHVGAGVVLLLRESPVARRGKRARRRAVLRLEGGADSGRG